MAVLRKTKSVSTLMAQFDSQTKAISAISLVGQLGSTMNKTTVYRTLDRLEDEGLIHSFLDKDGIKCYAKCQDCEKDDHHHAHPHFQCVSCGKIDCLEEEISLPKIPNRQIIDSQILIQGNCEDCIS